MAANNNAHFILAVGDDGTIVAQRIAPAQSRVSPVGAPVIAYTGPEVLAKADAARFALGCLLARAPATGRAPKSSTDAADQTATPPQL